jgi:hypothetical protein
MKTATKAQTAWTVGVASDYCVVGTNPEMADMSNPRGEIIRERFYLLATDARGNRKSFGSFETEQDAEVCFWVWSPMVDDWDDARPEYGSEAYVEYGQDDDLVLEAREREDEMWGLR